MDGTMNSPEPIVAEPTQRLPLLVKIVYGSGDWGIASFGTLRGFLLGIFFTDVVGLNAQLVSIAVLIGALWDAINDPLIGRLSDEGRLAGRLVAMWGRRRPFLLLFAIPYGLAFVAMWVAPPWESQLALLIHVTLAYMVSDTLFTLVSVPYFALTPELSADYDERTTLVSSRMVFNLVSSLFTAIAAPDIVRSAPTLQQGYTQVGIIFGVMAAFPFLAVFLVTRGLRFTQLPAGSPRWWSHCELPGAIFLSIRDRHTPS
jgi:Na+/melibiose symporter-like transporter